MRTALGSALALSLFACGGSSTPPPSGASVDLPPATATTSGATSASAASGEPPDTPPNKPGLEPAVIQRVVRAKFGTFKYCYEKGLAKNPTLDGQVRVRFVIDTGGAVASVEDAGSTMPDQEVRECIFRGFSTLSFPPPDGGKVTVVYPINFKPDEGADAGAGANKGASGP